MPLPPCVCEWRCRDQAAAHIGKALAASSPREPSGSAGWAGHGAGSVLHAVLQWAVVLGSRQKVSTADRSPGADRDPLYRWAAPTPLCKWHGGAVEASGHALCGVYLLGTCRWKNVCKQCGSIAYTSHFISKQVHFDGA